MCIRDSWMTAPMPPHWRGTAAIWDMVPGGPEKSCGKRASLRSFGTRRWTSCPRTGRDVYKRQEEGSGESMVSDTMGGSGEKAVSAGETFRIIQEQPESMLLAKTDGNSADVYTLSLIHI